MPFNLFSGIIIKDPAAGAKLNEYAIIHFNGYFSVLARLDRKIKTWTPYPHKIDISDCFGFRDLLYMKSFI